MDVGEGGDEFGVPLIGHDHRRAGLGDQCVRAADAEAGAHELGAQLLARGAHLAADVVRVEGLAGRLGQQPGGDVAVHVDGGGDDVRGALVGELHQPFAEIRLRDVDAAPFEVVIEADLLADHRLRLVDHADRVALAEVGDVAIGVLRAGAAVDGRARTFRRRLEPGEILLRLGDHAVLDGGQSSARNVAKSSPPSSVYCL